MINSEQRKKCNLKKLAELIHKAIEPFKQMKFFSNTCIAVIATAAATITTFSSISAVTAIDPDPRKLSKKKGKGGGNGVCSGKFHVNISEDASNIQFFDAPTPPFCEKTCIVEDDNPLIEVTICTVDRIIGSSEFLTRGGLAITGGVREYKGIRGAFDFDTDIEIEAVLQFAIVLDWTQIHG
ncbi:hypothetical protein FRACYDRAFT_238738 [Fragilariopsis cylindrus CCMP1102]|uniref:Uncharacterized protein n=1 Tax=Fragilariopsis cylindrus CCMP1102 TaxID=635003 RepID=A0A1E7FDC8_9STRA|nr:hypothetical protein FRACYDRAFT_238738 [Fragilariopsis cylindrus CCMP1102]|eukprot:OEU16151.1 hypothetical protein FRACYDRAFT_238738 [Fragilariopsis cylindrus CCMP1102]